MAEPLTILRPHLALTVLSVERSLPFYEALLGISPEKIKAGYAKFSVAEPALNVTLNDGSRDGVGVLNHAGIQVCCGCAAEGAADACCA